MNCKEIRDAALNGKTFTIKNVPIESIEFGDIQSCIDGLGQPVLFKTVNIKFVSPDIIDSVYSDNKDYPNIEVCEKPKHDPCRLFRKGDIVRLKEWNGRCPALPEDWKFDNGLFKVHEDEKFNSSVEITRENSKTVYIAPICFLELVIPVEELEPYYVEEKDIEYQVRMEKGGLDCLISVFRYQNYIEGYKQYYDILPTMKQAKAAAEAERDRLNAEWRKEQQ